jgi:hypothetical protein
MEEERALAVFERKILRRIYGPVKENESWGIRRNDELAAIIKGENIVRFIKSQRIRWLGHIERMQDAANPKKDVIRKAVCNKTKRKTKNEMAGRLVQGSEKDGGERMERQSKESRNLEAHCKGGQSQSQKRMLYGTLDATRRRGRPKTRWLEDVSSDLRKMGVNERRDRARNRETWRHIVKEVKAHPGL